MKKLTDKEMDALYSSMTQQERVMYNADTRDYGVIENDDIHDALTHSSVQMMLRHILINHNGDRLYTYIQDDEYIYYLNGAEIARTTRNADKQREDNILLNFYN